MSSQLQNAIEKLYEVFAKYPGNSAMQGSSNYDNLEMWNRELLSNQLKELSASDLSRFAGKAMTTWGDVNDYKHFLPRILELTAEFNTPYEIWIVFDKLEYGHWNSWNESEIKAIHQYMLQLWACLIKEDPDKTDFFFMDYFSSIAHFYPSFRNLLEVWQNNTDKNATLHLAKFIFNERANIFDKGVIPGFHNKREHIHELRSWLLSDKIITRLEEAFYKYEKESFAERISWAEKILNDEKRNSM